MKQVEERYISFEASKMAYRDIKNSIDTAKREGKEEGLAEGREKGLAEGMGKGLAEGMEKGLVKGLAEGMEKGMEKRSLEIARKMLANGMDAATVMEITGLSESQLQQLKG
jgi:predicted transposase YdaD